MKRFLLGLLATGAAAILGLGLASNASADPGGWAADPGASQTCVAVADEHRSVWAEPGTSDGAVGSVVAGRSYTAGCGLVEGDSYTACGSTTSLWAYVNYSGESWGYVPSSCVSWAS